ncbi:MAG: glycoside hydrolase family 43 protein [Armatimonadetes bacterium]|nr:glycoside hydrolase family 43 protein [Armatimonadota bacterium]
MSSTLTPNEGSPSGISYVNPVFTDYFADPFVFKVGSDYYAVGTGGQVDSASERVFRVLRSTNLVEWTPLGFALNKPEGHENGAFWAPEITQRHGRFYMYYSVGRGDKHHHLRVAVSESPEGPYFDKGQLSAKILPFAIDAHVYRHTDGCDYMFYAVDLLGGERPGTCLVVDRMLAPDRLEGNPHLVARATADWQRFEKGRSMYGGIYDWHTLEGPAAVWHDGRVYVFYSGGNWQNESYGVDFVTAEHPLGPYANGTIDRPRTLATSSEVLGPGHNSITVAADGKTEFAVYHGWDKERTARLMRIDPILWTDQGPVIDGPSVVRKTT